jgi:hypothetical protein
MKYIQALLILLLLITSKRYRAKWRDATEELSKTNDAVTASLLRISALDNDGKPRLQVLSTTSASTKAEKHDGLAR